MGSDLNTLSDQELLEAIRALRERLNQCEREIDSGTNRLEREEMRGLMSRFNQLKIEARRRGMRNEDV